MIYYIYLKQEGEGCDYTIGCGNYLTYFDAENIVEAQNKIEQLIKEQFPVGSDSTIESVLLFTSEPIEVDVDSIYTKERERINKKIEKETEEREKALYEKLKGKFETK